MTIQEAHLDFKLKWDKIDNKFNRNFTDEEIDWLLNESQMRFIRTRFNPSNIAKQGFEDTTSRTHELASIHVQFPEEPEITLTTTDYNTYRLSSIDTTALSQKFLYLTSLSVYNADCDKWVTPIFQNHATYLEELNNPFNKENCIFNINGVNDITTLYIYGNCTKARVSYIKHPNRVYIGTYTHPYINSTVAVGFNLPEHTHSIIVDTAVELAKGINLTDYTVNQITNVFS